MGISADSSDPRSVRRIGRINGAPPICVMVPHVELSIASPKVPIDTCMPRRWSMRTIVCYIPRHGQNDCTQVPCGCIHRPTGMFTVDSQVKVKYHQCNPRIDEILHKTRTSWSDEILYRSRVVTASRRRTSPVDQRSWISRAYVSTWMSVALRSDALESWRNTLDCQSRWCRVASKHACVPQM